MVAAVHFFAAADDETALLDYLEEPDVVTLHPWPVVTAALQPVPRHDLGSRGQVMLVHRDLGELRFIRPGDAAFSQASRAGVFNRQNWERLRPGSDGLLIDSNASPVLLWQRGGIAGSTVHSSDLGPQADSMASISREYERWVNRAMGWVRRRGTRVWGLERREIRGDLDIDLSYLNNVYALPGALALLESGGSAR